MRILVHRLLPAVAATACLSACLVFAPTAFAAAGDAAPQQSSNWAGYAVSDTNTVQTGTTDPAIAAPLQFTSVTATWTVPAVRCTAGTASFSSFWVGLGGYSSTANALEQTGTDADCSAAGKPSYYAWYELVPDPSTRVNLKVNAGDTISASVNWTGTQALVQVKNRTRKTSFTKLLDSAAPDLSSAEWIAEAPSQCSSADRCRVLPLANFGSVGFTRIATIANGHPGTLADTVWAAAQIRLVPQSSGRAFFGKPDNASPAGAAPAAVSADGRSFSVGWVATAI
jgi:hypothetical protein